MAAGPPSRQPQPMSILWLVGTALLFLGILALFSLLGLLPQVVPVALAVGLWVLSALMVQFYLSQPQGQGWAAWAAYLLFGAGTLVGVLILEPRPLGMAAVGVFLAATPFFFLYLNGVWLYRYRAGRTKKNRWWALLIAMGLLTFSLNIIELRLHEREAFGDLSAPGILLTTFMGGMALTLALLWFPNQEDPGLRWAYVPMIATALLTGLGVLLVLRQPFLAVPLVLLIVGALVINGARQQQERRQQPFTLSSDAFASGGAIPAPHTGHAENISPPLRWSGVPSGTRSLALLVNTRDAPGRPQTYWVLYNIPPSENKIDQNLARTPAVLSEARQGLNYLGGHGYSGPRPAPGDSYLCFFTLYALDTRLDLLPETVNGDILEWAAAGHILGEAQLLGKCAVEAQPAQRGLPAPQG